MKSKHSNFISMLVLFSCSLPAAAVSAEDMVLVPEGSFTPFFLKRDDANPGEQPKVKVEAFLMDATAVTNRKYQEFVSRHPDWHKANIKKIFTDSHYLEHWQNAQGAADAADLDKPVVNVSWFAAEAFCEAQGKRLPTTDEWEYTLTDNERDKDKLQKQIISWYSVPNKELPNVRSQPANGFGVYDLAGVIWEWTADFNSYMAPPDSRNSGDKTLFCGSGSLNASNLGDYAAFMRYSYRESLKGNFTGKNLGFRCAKDAK